MTNAKNFLWNQVNTENWMCKSSLVVSLFMEHKWQKNSSEATSNYHLHKNWHLKFILQSFIYFILVFFCTVFTELALSSKLDFTNDCSKNHDLLFRNRFNLKALVPLNFDFMIPKFMILLLFLWYVILLPPHLGCYRNGLNWGQNSVSYWSRIWHLRLRYLRTIKKM